ncbi:MAG: DNA-3-methyladenine glycosylase [Candidatus Saccharibacteria bacterium]|nr:DNA-3-methyladenine glycosylase [Candidatus Saccharibacteria bacterium]
MSLQTALQGPVEQVAARLLGCYLERRLDGQTMLVKIVETEAYHQSDAASHSYKGKTERTRVMFGPAGHLYVYFTYGLHYCCNVVAGPVGEGSAVLIRAVEPVRGTELIEARRGKTGITATNGPAKVCQALGIDKQLNGHELSRPPLVLRINPPLAPSTIAQTTRIGISRAKDVPWRFYIKDNPYASNPVLAVK